jgi:hypothetical protein
MEDYMSLAKNRHDAYMIGREQMEVEMLKAYGPEGVEKFNEIENSRLYLETASYTTAAAQAMIHGDAATAAKMMNLATAHQPISMSSTYGVDANGQLTVTNEDGVAYPLTAGQLVEWNKATMRDAATYGEVMLGEKKNDAALGRDLTQQNMDQAAQIFPYKIDALTADTEYASASADAKRVESDLMASGYLGGSGRGRTGYGNEIDPNYEINAQRVFQDSLGIILDPENRHMLEGLDEQDIAYLPRLAGDIFQTSDSPFAPSQAAVWAIDAMRKAKLAKTNPTLYAQLYPEEVAPAEGAE